MTYDILQNLEDILKHTKGVNKVSHGKPLNLEVEDTFTAVYITTPVETFDPFTVGKGRDSYDSKLFIKLVINTINDQGDDLEWVVTKDTIIDTVLEDNDIWTVLVDRDVVSVISDEYDNYPRKTIEIAFEFRSRAVC